MQARAYALAVVAAFAITACSDHPTAPHSSAIAPESPSTSRGAAKNAAERAALLTNVPITGTLADGGTFSGTLTATKISMDQATRQLTLTGVVNGTAMTAAGQVIDVVNQTVNTALAIAKPGAGPLGLVQPVAQASCSILNLVLGPLHLDLLGLVVDLNQVVLDITGATGAGNLLGNLLCAVTGLLDLPGAIAAVTNILGNINNILSGLTVPGVGGAMWIVPQRTFRLSTV